MEQQNDLYYIEKVLQGETNMFSYLVEKYKDIVFSIALKVLKNRDDAEEMAQEAFIKAYNSLSSFKGKSKFSTWLYSITYNLCISQTRKKKYDMSPLDDVQVSDESDDFGFDRVPDETRKKYLEAGLKRLNEEDQTLLFLYYYKDKSIDELAVVTKLSVSNTKVKLHRARKKLYKVLNEMLKEELHSLL